jgi:hypothetical protein
MLGYFAFGRGHPADLDFGKGVDAAFGGFSACLVFYLGPGVDHFDPDPGGTPVLSALAKGKP